jgi:hypothetical protein
MTLLLLFWSMHVDQKTLFIFTNYITIIYTFTILFLYNTIFYFGISQIGSCRSISFYVPFKFQQTVET